MKWVSSLLTFLAFTCMMSASEIYQQKIHALDGSEFDLSALEGKTVLFVNVASRCGFTKQYAGLQALYSELKDKNFLIIGVPSNDFGGQEPGTAEEIQTFCSTTYGVDFPLTEKVHVKGENKHPLYTFLTEKYGDPKWNFHKYLVDKEGNVVAAFPSKVAPESDQLRSAIQNAMN